MASTCSICLRVLIGLLSSPLRDFIAERGSNGTEHGGNSKQYWWVMLGALKQEHSIELMPVHLARTALLRRGAECGVQGAVSP